MVADIRRGEPQPTRRRGGVGKGPLFGIGPQNELAWDPLSGLAEGLDDGVIELQNRGLGKSHAFEKLLHRGHALCRPSLHGKAPAILGKPASNLTAFQQWHRLFWQRPHAISKLARCGDVEERRLWEGIKSQIEPDRQFGDAAVGHENQFAAIFVGRREPRVATRVPPGRSWCGCSFPRRHHPIRRIHSRPG